MIVPLTEDKLWREILRDTPAWTPPLERTVILSPHPDDETLGAGGLISLLSARNVEVTVAAVTDGEGAYTDEPGLGSIRRLEQIAALNVLGVQDDRIIRLGLPDRHVAEHVRSLVEMLTPLADETCHLVAPWTGDFHPDHEACGRAAEEVAKATGSRLSFYFFWTWHRGTPDALSDLSLKAIPLDQATVSAKAAALQKHGTQLHHSSGEPILPQSLLGPTLWPFEVFATA